VVQESVIDSIIWALIKEDPTRSCVQLNLALYDTLGVRVGTRWLRRKLKRWGMTWKKTEHIQINKFTTQNILYYAVYVTSILDFPVNRLKYADESHFESRGTARLHERPSLALGAD
jgi:hypothetical protein